MRDSRKRYKKNKYPRDTAHFSEFLDHQLFHGVRMTIELTLNDTISITEQLDYIIQNDWSSKNLKIKIGKILRIYSGPMRKVRRSIIADIDKQLESKEEIH